MLPSITTAQKMLFVHYVSVEKLTFSTSSKGAEASPFIYSVTATACANGLNVEDYFTNVFKSHGSELPLPR